MASHTPGPWRVQRLFHKAYIRSVANDDELVATVETDIDAHLIACLPSMLALLEKALPIIEAEAEMRECGEHSDPSTTDKYELEMRDLANEISAEIDKAKGKGVSDG